MLEKFDLTVFLYYNLPNSCTFWPPLRIGLMLIFWDIGINCIICNWYCNCRHSSSDGINRHFHWKFHFGQYPKNYALVRSWVLSASEINESMSELHKLSYTFYSFNHLPIFYFCSCDLITIHEMDFHLGGLIYIRQVTLSLYLQKKS